MRYLLDTHVLLWWLADDKALNPDSRNLIQTAQIYVSAASVWEITIKKSFGKLHAPDDIEFAIHANSFEPLSINLTHANVAGSFPNYHQDPFDRMLIAQAKIEELTIITHDKHICNYGVACYMI